MCGDFLSIFFFFPRGRCGSRSVLPPPHHLTPRKPNAPLKPHFQKKLKVNSPLHAVQHRLSEIGLCKMIEVQKS